MVSNSPYKGNKLEENNLTPCCKCDCLILSDSSEPNNDKCIRIKKTPKEKNIKFHGVDDEDSDKFTAKTEPVEVYMKRSSSGGDETTDTKSTSVTEKSSQAEAAPKENKKRLCFQFCRKKKNQPKKTISDGIQTSKPALNNAKTQSSAAELDDFVKNCTKFAKPGATSSGGGYNTNTIIFQKDPASGDGIANLEHWLRLEAKTNSRNLEEILNELHRQRREIRELKDMLDVIVRSLRDQLFMSAFGQAKNEMFALERKSNTLSMKKSISKQSKQETNIEASNLPETSSQSEEKKKKRFFLWCK